MIKLDLNMVKMQTLALLLVLATSTILGLSQTAIMKSQDCCNLVRVTLWELILIA